MCWAAWVFELSGGHLVGHVARRAFLRLSGQQLVLALLLFLPAWSLRFWQAWDYWGLSFFCALLTTLYLLRHDRGLIEQRFETGPLAEKEPRQRTILAVASVLHFALMMVPGLDHRYHWSAVGVPTIIGADGLVVLGYLIQFLAFRENSYAAGIVQVSVGQPVVSTGPYRMIRHPIYAADALMFLAAPLALGSLWALVPAVLLCAVVAVRLVEEEHYLSRHLLGYVDYRQMVRYRLVPLVW